MPTRTPSTHDKRRWPVGRVRPDDPQENTRDHERLWAAIDRLAKRVSGGGGGGSSAPAPSSSGELEALWWGVNPPLAIGPGPGTWTVPYVAGVSHTWTIARAKFRLEAASTAGSYTVKIQRSAAGGVFVPTDVATLVLAAGAHETIVTAGFGLATISSGDLLRVNWAVLGANAQNFTVQLEGNP